MTGTIDYHIPNSFGVIFKPPPSQKVAPALPFSQPISYQLAQPMKETLIGTKTLLFPFRNPERFHSPFLFPIQACADPDAAVSSAVRQASRRSNRFIALRPHEPRFQIRGPLSERGKRRSRTRWLRLPAVIQLVAGRFGSSAVFERGLK